MTHNDFRLSDTPLKLATASAIVVTCEKCDGNIELRSLQKYAKCPFCEHTQPLDDSTLEELRNYLAQLGDIQNDAAKTSIATKAWDNVTRVTSHRALLWNLVLVFGPLLSTLVVGSALIQTETIVAPTGSTISTLLVSSLLLGMVLSFLRFVFFPSRQTAYTAQIFHQLCCPSCGADNRIPAEKEIGQCSYCDASLLAPKKAQKQAIVQAMEDQRRAVIENHRSQRNAIAELSTRYGNGPNVLTMIFVSLGAIFLLVAANTTFNPSSTEENSVSLVAVLWSIPFLLASVPMVIKMIRRRKKTAFQSRIKTMVTQHSGTPLDGLLKEVDWLNTYWADYYDIEQLYHGPNHAPAVVKMDGYELMLHFDLFGKSRKWGSLDNIVLFLPCYTDDKRFVSDENANAIRKSLYLSGFVVESSPSGLVATSNSHAPSLADARGQTALFTAVTNLCNIARTLDAQPATEIPF